MTFDLYASQDRIERLADHIGQFQFSSDVPENVPELLVSGVRELSIKSRDLQTTAALNLSWWSDTLEKVTAINYQILEADLLELFGVIGRIFRESILVRGVVASGVSKQYLDFFSQASISNDFAQHADFINNVMPIYVARDAAFKAERLIKDIDRKISSWDGTLEATIQKVEIYKQNLEGHAQKFNFMGLSEAFNNIVSSKSTELKIQLGLLIVLGLTMLAIPSYNYLHPEHWGVVANAALKSDVLAISQITIAIALEIVVIYLFRVVLSNYISTQTQIVNLKLRSSLCAFVEQYAVFADSVRGKNGADTLIRFEQIIFSHAPTFEGKIPEATDGASQLLDILKQFKGKA